MANGNRRINVRRTATKELLVRFKRTGLFSFLRHYKDCEVIDFYHQGLGFISTEDLEKYDTLILSITYRFKTCESVHGIIVYKKPLSPHSFRYGLMFKEVDKATEAKLKEIEEMLG